VLAGTAVLAFNWVWSSDTETNKTTPAASPSIAGSTGMNDAELLLAHCGQPSSDDSAENDDPRPPIPSRIIEYKEKRLRFMFVPSGVAKLGDPPPYKWELIGITDMSAVDPSKARVVTRSEADKRMPCWNGQSDESPATQSVWAPTNEWDKRDLKALNNASRNIMFYTSSGPLGEGLIEANRSKPNKCHVYLSKALEKLSADVLLEEKVEKRQYILTLGARDTNEVLHEVSVPEESAQSAVVLMEKWINSTTWE
jgi:hypothetical protein